MEKNSLLSFCIPTFNRAKLLEKCLQEHIPVAKKYNIEINIFDNCSTDNTKEIVDHYLLEYPLINYYKNSENIGPDKNFQNVLECSKSKYSWLLGDTYKLPSNGVEYIMESISDERFDAIIFNLNNVIKKDSCIYTNPDDLLYDLGGIMSCISCLVFSNTLIENANFEKFYDTNYIQTGIIFDSISKINMSNIAWVSNISVTNINTENLKRSWTQSDVVFEIGCKRWQDFIFKLSETYSHDSKIEAIKSFGIVSNIWTFRNILTLRKKKLLTYKIFKKYDEYFKRLTVPYSLIKIISLSPVFLINLLRLLIKIYSKIKQYKKYINRIKNVLCIAK